MKLFIKLYDSGSVGVGMPMENMFGYMICRYTTWEGELLATAKVEKIIDNKVRRDR